MNDQTPIILGLGSRARIGKDHACKLIAARYPNTYRVAFADALKWDLKVILPDALDPFTTNPATKEMIRPLLVNYGMLLRAHDPAHWIKQAFKQIDDVILHDQYAESPLTSPRIFVIPDARFANEVEAIKERGGFYVEIESEVPYANEQEAFHSPQCARLADFTIFNAFVPGEPDADNSRSNNFEQQVLGVMSILTGEHELSLLDNARISIPPLPIPVPEHAPA